MSGHNNIVDEVLMKRQRGTGGTTTKRRKIGSLECDDGGSA